MFDYGVGFVVLVFVGTIVGLIGLSCVVSVVGYLFGSDAFGWFALSALPLLAILGCVWMSKSKK